MRNLLLLATALILAGCTGAPPQPAVATPVPAATLAPTRPPTQSPSTQTPVPTQSLTPTQPAATPTTLVTPTVPALGGAGSLVQIGAALNRDVNAAGTDPSLTVGALEAGKLDVAWAAWAEKQGNSQQIFVSRQTGNKFEFAGGTLNIHANVVAEGPSIDFAGANRTVPWVAWYEPSPGFGNTKNIFASRFNATSALWTAAGQDRGNNEPSLNIHTNQPAENPNLVGGTTDPTKPPSPWVCWQEKSAYRNAVQIFVSRAVADPGALGGFRWQPVGLNRGGTAYDPEPSVNVDVRGSNSDRCSIVFAETNNAVPWVVWAERRGNAAGQIFVARAVADNTTGAGGFKWQFVPNCTGPQDAAKCTLNVNPTKDASQPFMTAGSVTTGQAPVPWIVWTEVGPTGKRQIFVDRLDLVSRNTFLNVGASLNVDANRDAEFPSMTFIGKVPYVTWSEQVGNGRRIFVRHLASDPQTGTWALDTPKEGLAIDKTLAASNPVIRPASDGKPVLIWREGDPAKEASKIVVVQLQQ